MPVWQVQKVARAGVAAGRGGDQGAAKVRTEEQGEKKKKKVPA